MKNFVLKSAFVLVMFFAFSGCSSDPDDDTIPCPPGYTGTYCEIQKTPVKIKITKVVITNFPTFTSVGDFWDNGEDTSGNRPDLFFALGKNTTGSFFIEDNYKIDSYSNATFIMSTPIEITDINGVFSIDLWDFDGGVITDSDFMETAYFTLYNPGTGFPESVVTSGAAPNLTAEFFLTYEF